MTRILEQFLEGCSDRKSTRNLYKSCVLGFLSYIFGYKREGSPKRHYSVQEMEMFEAYASQYITEKRDYHQDLIDYVKSYNGRTTSMTSYTSIIREFLKKQKIIIDDVKEIKRKMPKRFAKSKRAEIDTEVIRTILSHSDEKVKAILLIAASSGMRISEILILQDKNITPVKNQDIFKIYIEGDEEEKTGHEKTTFITPEAMRAVNEWKKIRSQYFDGKKFIGKNLTKEDTGLIFPFTESTFNKMFNLTLQKAGLYERDEKTCRSTITIHMMRTFFRTSMIASGVPEGIVEHLIHYSSKAYRDYTDKQLVEAYLKGVESVSTETDPVLKKKYSEAIERVQQLSTDQNSNTQNITFLIKQLSEHQAAIKVMDEKIKVSDEEIKTLKKFLREHWIIISAFAKSRGIKTSVVSGIKTSDTSKIVHDEEYYKIIKGGVKKDGKF